MKTPFFIISPNEFAPINFPGLIEETPIQTVPDSVSKRATRENEIENKQTKIIIEKKNFYIVGRFLFNVYKMKIKLAKKKR